jgi:hypothetical protein
VGLDRHLVSGTAADPAEAAAWPTTPEGTELVRLAGGGWEQAAIGDGDDPEQARTAAPRSVALYTTPPGRGQG